MSRNPIGVQSPIAEQPEGVHLALLAGLVLLVYGASVTLPLFGDDVILAARAAQASWSFHDLSRSFELGIHDFTSGWVPEVFEGYRLYFFRPVFMALLKVDYALWGHWEPGYHVANLVLEWAVAALIYVWAVDLRLTRGERLLAAGLFVLYTVNYTAVNWIAGRTELLAATLMLSSLVCLGRFYRSRQKGMYLAALSSYLLALGAKENAVILPLLHVLGAVTVYRNGDQFGTIRKRMLAIAPFFLVLPAYFALRAWALGGFPVPVEGYYYHSPWHPEFPRFALTKTAHAVLTLVYQAPAGVLPALLERSGPAIVVMSVAAAVTLLFLYRRVTGPVRWFAIGWVALTLAPTVPIGYNPIYFFLPAVAMPFVYVMLYRRWQGTRRGISLLVVLVGGGVVVCAMSPFFLRSATADTRSVAADIVDAAYQFPETEIIYLVDFPARHQFAIPEARWRAPELREKQFVVLNLSPIYLRPAPSDVHVVNPHTIELHASEATFGTTGFEHLLLRRDIIDFYPGFTFGTPAYSGRILAVEPTYDSRVDSPMVAALRRHLELPPHAQAGVKTLQFQFREPLTAPQHVFLQITSEGVRPLEFPNDV